MALNLELCDYMSDTKRIYPLATCYDMPVIFYDREYRRLQHQHKLVFFSCRFRQHNTMSGGMKSGFKGQPKHIVYASHSSAGEKICKRFATDGEIDNTERIIMATEAIAVGIRPDVISKQHYPKSVMIHISEISWNS